MTEMKPTKEMEAQNRVLTADRKTSDNHYYSDRILRHYIKTVLSQEAQAYMEDKYAELGEKAAGMLNELSMLADHKGPELVKRTPYGETCDDILFHPAYWEMMDIAAKSEMFYAKWASECTVNFKHEAHTIGFVSGMLFAMSESGQYCPLAMTDGVARLVDLYGSEEDKARLLPGLYARTGKELRTGAMFLTEKSGGSDVGANLTAAKHVEGRTYHLTGEKWFCSNVNADLIFVLARTNPDIKGTKGLSIFLVEKYLPNGGRNPMEIVRIKDKLGVRSMASGECLLKNTVGTLYGEEGEGMKIMLDMIALMRLYNAVAALAGERRGLVEAYQHLKYRSTFGKNAMQHALIRHKLHELGSLYAADFYLTWRTVKALELADIDNEREKILARLLIPMTKYQTGINTVYIVRECMELMGGVGYVEDLIMPKLFRDVLVLPIWEGAGNIMLLDMLRALFKSPESLELLLEDIEKSVLKMPVYDDMISREVERLTALAPQFRYQSPDARGKNRPAFFSTPYFADPARLPHQCRRRGKCRMDPPRSRVYSQLLAGKQRNSL